MNRAGLDSGYVVLGHCRRRVDAFNALVRNAGSAEMFGQPTEHGRLLSPRIPARLAGFLAIEVGELEGVLRGLVRAARSPTARCPAVGENPS